MAQDLDLAQVEDAAEAEAVLKAARVAVALVGGATALGRAAQHDGDGAADERRRTRRLLDLGLGRRRGVDAERRVRQVQVVRRAALVDRVAAMGGGALRQRGRAARLRRVALEAAPPFLVIGGAAVVASVGADVSPAG